MSDVTVETPTPSATLAALSPASRQAWRLTGSLPDAPPSDPLSTSSTDSSSVVPAVPDTSTDVSASTASEPVTPKKRSTAESRKPELEREIQTLLDRRRALREEVQREEGSRRVSAQPPTPAAASSPAPEPETVQAFLDRIDPTQPYLTEGEFFERFSSAAYGDYTRYTVRYEHASQHARQSQQDRAKGLKQSFDQRVEQAIKDDPTFTSKLNQDIVSRIIHAGPSSALPPGVSPTAMHIIGEEILLSPVAPQVFLYLSEHPGELDRLAGLPNEAAIVREFGRLEVRLTSSPSVPSPTPVVKTTTSAPAPPEVLGRKPAAPADEASAALAAGDVRRYITIMNRRETGQAVAS